MERKRTSKGTGHKSFFSRTFEHFLNPIQQCQDEPELAMMASTAQEAASLALIENDSKVWVFLLELGKIAVVFKCKPKTRLRVICQR